MPTKLSRTRNKDGITDKSYHIQYPHCDSRILHAPGECEFCDASPDLQEVRKAWGINFTDHFNEYDPEVPMEHWKMLPCPANFNRDVGSLNHWPGNLREKNNHKIFTQASKNEANHRRSLISKIIDWFNKVKHREA